MSDTTFIAVCKCGMLVGCIDSKLHDKKNLAQILGEFVLDGCQIEELDNETAKQRIRAGFGYCQCDRGEK